MWGILLPILIGIAVGYFSPGKQDKSHMFKIGALWALGLAIVIAIIGYVTGNNPLTGGSGAGFLSLFLSFIVSLVLFLVGVWIGDLLEGRKNRRATPPPSPPQV
ncbi:MAG: hypothetical protein QOE90_2983 [Thermoplasmata archaeon]|nr:hypothetical protein [Thermoplasmata archaeon]